MDYDLKSVDTHYDGHHFCLCSQNGVASFQIDGETIGYFENIEESEKLFQVMSDMFTAFDTIGGFEKDE